MHLLPPNSTAQERALSLATERAASVPVFVKTLWTPADCPAGVLPWLAWSLSVEPWRSDWSDAQKRVAITAAIETHRIKGTPEAVRRALHTLGYEVDIDETGAVYTFRLLVDVEGKNLRNVDLDPAKNAAIVAKNARSHLRAISGMLKSVVLVTPHSVAFDGESTFVEADCVREIRFPMGMRYLSAVNDCQITTVQPVPPGKEAFRFAGHAVGASAHFQTFTA